MRFYGWEHLTKYLKQGKSTDNNGKHQTECFAGHFVHKNLLRRLLLNSPPRNFDFSLLSEQASSSWSKIRRIFVLLQTYQTVDWDASINDRQSQEQDVIIATKKVPRFYEAWHTWQRLLKFTVTSILRGAFSKIQSKIQNTHPIDTSLKLQGSTKQNYVRSKATRGVVVPCLTRFFRRCQHILCAHCQCQHRVRADDTRCRSRGDPTMCHLHRIRLPIHRRDISPHIRSNSKHPRQDE